MKHKKTLLVFFFLVLFLLQQAQVDAKGLPNVEGLLNTSYQASGLPSTVLVFMKEFTPDGEPTNNLCFQGSIILGCVETNSGLTYPPSSQYITFPQGGSNPMLVDIEHYYLYNVLPREMDVKTYTPTLSTLPALKAQALAARSIADFKSRVNGGWVTNVTTSQVFVPGSFEYYNPAATNLIQQAVDETSGEYLSYSGESIDAEFSNDIDNPTVLGNWTDYLKSVQEPISPSCDLSPVETRGNGWGMSQKGAMRWAKGNQCAGSGNQPWPVHWGDYRQILAHYYTGVDILNGSGGKVAPDNRWNLLNHTVPSAMQLGHMPYTVTFTVQNTSTTDWGVDTFLSWSLLSNCGAGTSPSGWHYVPLDSTKGHRGESQTVTVTLPAPTQSGMQILHVDMERGGNQFHDGTPAGWPDVEIPIQVDPLTAPPLATNANPGFYPYGITGCYYNDVSHPYTLDAPISWPTFTSYITSVGNQTIDFHFIYPFSTHPAPGVFDTFWSARWVGILNVPEAGNYTFYLNNLDDGGRLWVDHIADSDTPVVTDGWQVHGPSTYQSLPVTLSAGPHNFRVDFAQGPAGESQLHVMWKSNDSQVVPLQVIDRSAPHPATTTILGNAGLGGATLSYIDGTPKTVTADANGDYTLVVSNGWSGEVMPSLAGYAFNPPSRSYDGMYFDQLTTTPDYTTTVVPIVTVTNSGNTGAGSLRDAIAGANPGATIVFDPSLSGQTISLNSTLILSKNVTIDGSALTAPVIIKGKRNVTGLTVNSGVTATLNHLTITQSEIGIINNGALTVRNSTFSANQNTSTAGGGAISNQGTLTVTNSTFTGNTATNGGGIYNSSANCTVASSTFSNNSATENGGGIFNFGSHSDPGNTPIDMTILASTFVGNTAQYGGGIYNGTDSTGAQLNYYGALTVTNSTLSGNSATTYGGGIYIDTYNYATSTITNSTLSGNNTGFTGGGILVNGLQTQIRNTIIWGNTGFADAQIDIPTTTTSLDLSNSIIQSGCPVVGNIICTNIITTDPLLGTLGNYGGFTQTIPLLTGSSALDTGDDATCTATDQRDISRPQNAHCDIGAYEVEAIVQPAPTVVSIKRAGSNPTNAASVDFTVTFSEPVNNVDSSDFSLAANGIGDATIDTVNGSGAVYTVTVNTGTTSGSLRLDIPSSASITNLAGKPLAGLPYISGESYSIDKTAPDTQIDNHPADPSTAVVASFEFSSTEPGATFECKLDSDSYAACVSPKQYTDLTVGSHTFSVRSTDTAGNTDSSSANYTWSVNPIISGNTGVPDATLSYIDGTLKTATADNNGLYSLVVSYNWSGTVTPSKTGYNFTPVSRDYSNVVSNQISQNFTATLTTYTISGTLGINGAGATVTYTGGSTTAASGTGNYSFTVSYGWTGTITPSKAGVTFSPTSLNITNPVTADLINQNFTATINTYTISGTLGKKGAGATITYTGGTTTANSNGNYSFTVPYGWTGSITPSKTGNTFSPTSLNITTPITSNLSNQNFTTR
jgi:hypothetical protein